MPRNDGLDELLPPEPDDEPEEDTPELDPQLWDDEPVLEGDLDPPDTEDDEDLLPNEALEDDRWWPPESADEDLDDEIAASDLTDELPLGGEDERWRDLEDESRYVSDGLVRLGWRERALLLDHALEVYAVCDTGSAVSKVRARMIGREGDCARIELDGRELEVAVLEEGGVLQVRLSLQVAGVALDAALVHERDTEGEALVLGRDLLAGRFLVDVSMERPVML